MNPASSRDNPRTRALPIVTPRRGFLAQSLAAGVASSPLWNLAGSLAANDVPAAGPAAFLDKTKTFDSSIKQRAREDYRRSFEQWGGRLSNPIDELLCQPHDASVTAFDFLIIG